MKKLISILIMSLCVFCGGGAQAQAFNHTTTSPTGVIVNAGRVDTMEINVTTSSDVHGVQIVLTKNSGTLSSGTMILSGTVDGTHYDNIDTLTIANAAINKVTLKYEHPVYTKYRIITTVVGATSNVTTSAFAVGRKYY